jgi:hypothetical protein
MSDDRTNAATSDEPTSLRADLEAAWEAASDEASPETVETPEVDTPSAEEAPVETPTDEPVAEEAAPEEAKPEAAAPTVTVPASWKPEMREKFAELPEDIRTYVMQRENEMSTKFRENAQARQIAENFNSVITPYQDLIQQQGSNPYAAVKEVLEVAKRLNTGTQRQKAELLGELFTLHKVDLNDLNEVLTERLSAPQPTNAERAILERQERIERLLQERNAPPANPASGVEPVNTAKVISDFATDPKNEFFSDVQADMATPLTTGKAADLKEAYDMAVRVNPEVQKVLADRKAKEKQRATAGNVSVKGSAPKAKPQAEKELGLREHP